MLSVATAVLVQDTARLEAVQGIASEWVEDQARCLLEDMPVRAFKVGGLYSPEVASTVAQVVADYPEVPLVLHLGLDADASDEDDDESTDDTVVAQLELLVPQAHLVVVDHRRLDAWYSEGLLPKGESENAVQALLSLGAEHVFLTDVPHGGGSPVNVLAGQAPEAEAWTWRRLPGRYRGADSTMSAEIAALLAHGRSLREAVIDAQQFTRRSLEAAYQPGMGQEVPDRLFWARGSDSDADSHDAANGEAGPDENEDTP